jgi:hypothetical protein
VSPERKRNVRRRVKEREAMSGVLLTRILERLKELKKGRNKMTEKEVIQ